LLFDTLEYLSIVIDSLSELFSILEVLIILGEKFNKLAYP